MDIEPVIARVVSAAQQRADAGDASVIEPLAKLGEMDREMVDLTKRCLTVAASIAVDERDRSALMEALHAVTKANAAVGQA